MRRNRVKQLLKAGEPALGTFMALGSTLGAEQLAQLGFDWLVIDQEHGAIDATLTQSLLQAISTTETVPLVRVPENGVDWIKRALDAGAYGLVVPMVNDRADAEAAVRATRYPPLGARSIGGSRTRLYGGPDYVEHANEEILLMVQIEHITAVGNAREILSVPGIDGYFIGPGDLCASMGLPNTWDPDFPEYWAALEKVQRVAKELGVPGGIHSSPGRVTAMLEKGYQFVAVGFDISFMASAASAALQAARPTTGTRA
jgi:4-hydroxy-2-oxoheptanedioate aldolase